MTTHSPATFVRGALWVAPIVIVPVAVFASLPWLKQQTDAIALGISAAASIFVMGYALFLATRVNRRLDEVEVAGQRFSHAKGMTIGQAAAVLVMIFPPAMNALADLSNIIGAGSPDTAVKVGIAIGFMLVVFLQGLGMAAVSVWWQRRIGGQA